MIVNFVVKELEVVKINAQIVVYEEIIGQDKSLNGVVVDNLLPISTRICPFEFLIVYQGSFFLLTARLVNRNFRIFQINVDVNLFLWIGRYNYKLRSSKSKESIRRAKIWQPCIFLSNLLWLLHAIQGSK